MNLSEAEAHAQLGIPVPKGTPNRFLKRLVAKLSWFFLHHQVAYNLEVIKELNSELGPAGLKARLEAQEARLSTKSAILDTLGRDIWAANFSPDEPDRLPGRRALGGHSGALEGIRESAREFRYAISGLLSPRSPVSTMSSAVTSGVPSPSRPTRSTPSPMTCGKRSMRFGNRSVTLAQSSTRGRQHSRFMLISFSAKPSRHHEGIGSLRSELVEMSLKFEEIHGRIEAAASRMNEQVAALYSEIEAAASESRRRQGTVDTLLHEVRRSLPEPLSPKAIESLRPRWTLLVDFGGGVSWSSSAVGALGSGLPTRHRVPAVSRTRARPRLRTAVSGSRF